METGVINMRKICLVAFILSLMLLLSACSGTVADVVFQTDYSATAASVLRFTGSAATRTIQLAEGAKRVLHPAKESDTAGSHSASSIELSKDHLDFYFGDKVTLTASVIPVEADQSVVWSSTDESVITVGENGTLSPVGVGKAEIVCTAADGSGVSARCPVNVYIGVKSLTISKEKVNLLFGGSEDLTKVDLSCTVSPEAASFQAVEWSSSDESVAVVNRSGVVTAISAGKATITATSSDPRAGGSITASCVVSVGDAVQEIQISGKGRIVVGKDAQMKATVFPETALSTKVKWSSSDSKVLKIDKDGKVHAVATGKATITATAKDGSGVVATKEITVYQPVTKLTPSKKSITMFAGQSRTLKVKVSPAKASDKSLTWKSSKNSVATVDQNGVVTAKKKGTATITATAKDGSGIKCSIKVTVEPGLPINVPSVAFGIYNGNLLALNVKNKCAKKTIVNFDFDIKLISYSGETLYTSGSYNLGKNVKIAPGSKLQIKRNLSGVSSTYLIRLTITAVKFSDGTKYQIPLSKQETWIYSRG